MPLKKSVRILLIFMILLSCIGCDQGTKSLAKKHLIAGQTLSYAHDIFRLQFTENTGAFLGMGNSLPVHLRFTIFTVMVAGFLLVSLGYLFFNSKIELQFTLAATLVLAGGISNLADRVLYGGRVIDFMNMGIGNMRTGIFNVADICIMAGTGLLIFFLYRNREQKE